ncbi:hypothetical protein H4R19_004758 [Coemansia spiralis]|nr:hypothetical protein H4R19_004758 [Coemansia spiralis]
MAALVAFDESPLAEYLREIGAGEALVVEDPQPSLDIVSERVDSSVAVDRPAVAALIHDQVVCMLAESGHLAERFTPVRTSRCAKASTGIPLDSVAARDRALRAAARQTAAPLAVGSLLLCQRRLLLPGHATLARASTAAGALLAALAAALATACAWRQLRAERAVRRANSYIGRLHSALRSCRALDASVHRALRFVQEAEFAARGFRLPQPGPAPGIASRSGRGTQLVTLRTRVAVGAVLDRVARVLVGVAREMADGADGDAELLGAASDAYVNLEAAGTPDDPPLGALRATFDMVFGLRRLWLVCICEKLERLAHSGANDGQLLRGLRATNHGIERVCVAATAGLDELARVREAQYTASRWESLAAAGPGGGGHSSQPLQRALGAMSEVLGTIQAKVLVCRECVDADGSDSTPVHVARVFASLKADIDMLSVHYQESVTGLLCVDGGSAVCVDDRMSASPAVAAMAMDVEAIADDARIFECTPFSTDALDAPELAFEADAESSRRGPRAAPTVARSERIRQQRERRAEEVVVRERQGDITTMMAELRSAIGPRAKGSAEASGGP